MRETRTAYILGSAHKFTLMYHHERLKFILWVFHTLTLAAIGSMTLIKWAWKKNILITRPYSLCLWIKKEIYIYFETTHFVTMFTTHIKHEFTSFLHIPVSSLTLLCLTYILGNVLASRPNIPGSSHTLAPFWIYRSEANLFNSGTSTWYSIAVIFCGSYISLLWLILNKWNRNEITTLVSLLSIWCTSMSAQSIT